MGARGPAPAPVALRLLTGRSPGRDSGGREVELPPPFDKDAPDPPEWLQGYGLEVWHRVLPELDRLQLVKVGDGEQFAVYCDQVARYAEATTDVRVHGMILEMAAVTPEHYDPDYVCPDGSRGGFVKKTYVKRTANPSVAIARAAADAIVRLAREFGLTPSSEANLAGLDGAPKSGGAADGDSNPFAQTG